MQQPKPMGQPCDICGDIGFVSTIVTCSRCRKSREHIYCMQPNLNKLPESWYCEACICPKMDHCHPIGPRGDCEAEACDLPKACPKGVRRVTFNIPDACGSLTCKPAARLLSRNFVPKKVETGKVKFIPLEDIHTLPSKTMLKKPPSQGFRNSQMLSFGIKCRPSARKTSVSSPENQHAFKSAGHLKPPVGDAVQTGSPEKQSVKLSQPLNRIKSPSHFFCKSSISENSKSASALTIRDQKHISEEVHHSPRDYTGAVVHSIQQKCKSKNVSPGLAKHKDKLNSLLSKDFVTKEPAVGAIVPYAQDGTSISKTLFKIMEEDLPNPPAEHDAWQGSFEVSDFLHDPYEKLQAYPPEYVSRKAYLMSKQMPEILQFILLPRCSVWPEIFNTDSPSGFDIGLYFRSDTFSRSREKYNILVQHMVEKDLSLKTLLDGVQLLIFTSKLLPPKSQSINKQYYLWGVFAPFKHPVNVTNKVDDHLVDMDIDTVGGRVLGTRDRLLKRSSPAVCRDGLEMLPQDAHVPRSLNPPPGFSMLSKLQERASPSQISRQGGPRAFTKKIKVEFDST